MVRFHYFYKLIERYKHKFIDILDSNILINNKD